MPYRHAHYWLLSLFPLIVISFWPGYFGHLTTARLAQHAHGMTATAWLALLTVQSWSTHARRFAWHRAAGLAVFAVVPLFAGAVVYGVADMAAEMNAGSGFETTFAPALAPDDLSSMVALVGFVAAALASRRRVTRHAAWMLATALLVLPPLTARLIQVVARFVDLSSPSFFSCFVASYGLTIAVAAVLAGQRPRDAKPYLVLIALSMAKVIGYTPLGASPAWRALLARFGATSPLPAIIAAIVLALATLVLAWRRVPPRRGAARNPARDLRAAA